MGGGLFCRVAYAYCMGFNEERLILFSCRLSNSGQHERLGGSSNNRLLQAPFHALEFNSCNSNQQMHTVSLQLQ